MEFDPRITIGNIVLAVGILIAAAGLFINAVQLLRNWRVQKSQFLATISASLFEDNDLRKLFYKIDYEKFTFSEERLDEFKGSEDELHIDSLLYRYDLIGRLVRTNVLTMTEIEYLLFEIVQVHKNADVKRYINWLDGEYARYGTIGLNTRVRPHDDSRWLMEKLQTCGPAQL